MDQPKIERILRIMKMLTGNISYTIDEISDKLEISIRTVYRYIDTLRAAGFVIKKSGEYYKIDKSSPHYKDISNLLHFTEEESHILKKAIDSIDENNLLKQNLKRKLATVYDYKILAETTVKRENANNINTLIEAIEAKKQIKLINYSSANSNATNDRIVEAFSFTTNYIQIWAYEIESKKNKLFKVSRIENIEILEKPWQNISKHIAGHIDIFRISSYEQKNITLKLSLRAAMLLMEEYPLAERDLSKNKNNEWILKTKVCSFEGIGRFVMGLLEDIEIIESDEFKMFIVSKIQKTLPQNKISI